MNSVDTKQIVEVDLLGGLFGQESSSLQNECESKEKKPNMLFDIIKSLFTNKGYVANITEQQANQNIFMILRRVAINHPLQANMFNNGKVNALDVIKFLSDYLYCGRVPGWVYTSTSESTKKKKSNDITKNDIKEYLEFYDINRKDFEFAMKIYSDESLEEVKEYRDYMKKLKSKNEQEKSNN